MTNAPSTLMTTTHARIWDARKAAAYRSGSKLETDHNRAFDFTRKEDVIYSNVLTPDDAPAWASNRQALWNKVEQAEKRKDARLARDIIAALPRDLSREQQIALVNEFVRQEFTNQGMVADVNIHEKDASDGGRNPHVHIMLTTRNLDGDGFASKKEKSWDGEFKGYGFGKGETVEHWRAAFEKLSNEYLEDAGADSRVSLKSYHAQGIDKIPQKHLGYEAANLEKRGKETIRGDENRHIWHTNTVAAMARPIQEEQHIALHTTKVVARLVDRAVWSARNDLGNTFEQVMGWTTPDEIRAEMEQREREAGYER